MVITAASVQDGDGARLLLAQVPPERQPELLVVWADAAYQGRLEEEAAQQHEVELVIVPKLEGQTSFVVLPKRWIVERTLAWLMRYRRLRADYETEPRSSTAWIYTAMIHLMVRRLAA